MFRVCVARIDVGPFRSKIIFILYSYFRLITQVWYIWYIPSTFCSRVLSFGPCFKPYERYKFLQFHIATGKTQNKWQQKLNWSYYLRAVGRKVLWSSACVCLCALFLSARYLKNGFMDHHQIWWMGAGGEPLEQVQFWCWSDSGCVSRITFPFPLTLMLATASAQVCVPSDTVVYILLLWLRKLLFNSMKFGTCLCHRMLNNKA